MERKSNWSEFKRELDVHNIKKLYHFTDFENLKSIISNGGLFSWKDCDDKGICIPKPGGSFTSRDLDCRDGLERFVRVSFTAQHPMMYVAMNDGRLSNPVVLEIDPEVVFWKSTLYSDRNATKNGAQKGDTLDDFKSIHFDSVKARNHFDLDEDEQPFYQAEVLVKNFIPLKCITNIGNFGLPIPVQPDVLQPKIPYSAQITRNTPTAFIFLVDQSVSMSRKVEIAGERITMAEAVARIVNSQIEQLVSRCVKLDEIRHYYDIAVIGYGKDAYSGWNGELAGRDFVSPQELKDNPFKKILVREEVRTRAGVSVKEIEKVQWLTACCDGDWTHAHKAFKKAGELLESWLEKHQGKDCYPPTVINITDGEFNGATEEHIRQCVNNIKSMFTNDGNVQVFNIHIVPNRADAVAFPVSKAEMNGNEYGELLADLSSLLPQIYNKEISKLRGDNSDERHIAVSVNADMNDLVRFLNIGTPTNIKK